MRAPATFILALTLLTGPAMAQNAVSFGAISADPSAPVEVNAGQMSVDQESGRVTLTDDVKIGQGNLRLAAAQVEVRYDADGNIIDMEASGNVTMTTPTEAAEANSASYNLVAATLVMRGDVLITQGNATIAADSMNVDLTTGNATLSGQVRTVFGGQ